MIKIGPTRDGAKKKRKLLFSSFDGSMITRLLHCTTPRNVYSMAGLLIQTKCERDPGMSESFFEKRKLLLSVQYDHNCHYSKAFGRKMRSRLVWYDSRIFRLDMTCTADWVFKSSYFILTDTKPC